MNIDALRKLVTQAPFVPLRLHLDNGRSLVLPHPEFCLLAPNSKTAFIFTDRNKFEIVDIHHIGSIEPVHQG